MNGENTNGPLAVTSLLSSPLKGKGQGEELGKGLILFLSAKLLFDKNPP